MSIAGAIVLVARHFVVFGAGTAFALGTVLVGLLVSCAAAIATLAIASRATGNVAIPNDSAG